MAYWSRKMIWKMPSLVRRAVISLWKWTSCLKGRKNKKDGRLWNFHASFSHGRYCMHVLFAKRVTLYMCLKTSSDFTVYFNGVLRPGRERDLVDLKKRLIHLESLLSTFSCFNISVEVFNKKKIREPHVFCFTLTIGNYHIWPFGRCYKCSLVLVSYLAIK